MGTPELNDADGCNGIYCRVPIVEKNYFLGIKYWLWHHLISSSFVVSMRVSWPCEKNHIPVLDLRLLSWYWFNVSRNLELNKWLSLFALCFLLPSLSDMAISVLLNILSLLHMFWSELQTSSLVWSRCARLVRHESPAALRREIQLRNWSDSFMRRNCLKLLNIDIKKGF